MKNRTPKQDLSHFYKLETVIDNLHHASILCIGDLMFDQFISGQVSRISPEAPIPILRIISEHNALGGVGNVAHNLTSLGATCHLIGLVGSDVAGNELIDMLSTLPNLKNHIIVDNNHTTICKTRFIARNQQLLRVDREIVQTLSLVSEKKIITLIEKIVPSVDCIILSDYGKGILSQPIIDAAISAGKKLKKTVLVDPKGVNFTKYQNADVITPNQNELENATGLPADTDKEVIHAAEKIIKEAGIETVLVTRGSAGMMLVSKNHPPFEIPTQAQDIIDLSGAGDTVLATFSAACATGSAYKEAAEISNIAAGVVVGKIGTAAIRKGEIKQAMSTRYYQKLESKLVGRDEAFEIREFWRRKNMTVGFTNGCFDLLHAGHIMLLHKARQQCDHLIVALNNDKSVRRLKGDPSPVQDEITRAMVLSSLKDVDLIIIFEEDTPIDLIAKLTPDLLVKGSDYSIDEVVGAEIVQKTGGRVLLVDSVPNQSTSGIIKLLAKAGKKGDNKNG